jgi:hypothetical protein
MGHARAVGLERTWVGLLGSAWLDRICFFSEFIFNAKQFQKKI